jgi:CheY-like chemotaxis protein
VNRNGPIIILEDDIDDQDILKEVFINLDYSNELLFYPDGYKALEFLEISDVIPFLILSDVNVPSWMGLNCGVK